MEQNVIYIPLVLSVIGLVYMFIRASWVKKQASGSERMQEISKAIKEGALAFLNAEYRLLLIFVIVASVALFGISIAVDTTSWMIVPAFVFGAFFSALAGNIGMRIATDANARTAEAAKTSLPKLFKFLLVVERLWDLELQVLQFWVDFIIYVLGWTIYRSRRFILQ